jgi:hypothetical protein
MCCLHVHNLLPSVAEVLLFKVEGRELHQTSISELKSRAGFCFTGQVFACMAELGQHSPMQ